MASDTLATSRSEAEAVVDGRLKGTAATTTRQAPKYTLTGVGKTTTGFVLTAVAAAVAKPTTTKNAMEAAGNNTATKNAMEAAGNTTATKNAKKMPQKQPSR